MVKFTKYNIKINTTNLAERPKLSKSLLVLVIWVKFATHLITTTLQLTNGSVSFFLSSLFDELRRVGKSRK